MHKCISVAFFCYLSHHHHFLRRKYLLWCPKWAAFMSINFPLDMGNTVWVCWNSIDSAFLAFSLSRQILPYLSLEVNYNCTWIQFVGQWANNVFSLRLFLLYGKVWLHIAPCVHKEKNWSDFSESRI